VSTCLPTIIRQFHGSQAEFTWIGVAYLLTQTACQPLYGKISDLVGRKVDKFDLDLNLSKKATANFPLVCPFLKYNPIFSRFLAVWRRSSA
jgi:MFS family permease